MTDIAETGALPAADTAVDAARMTSDALHEHGIGPLFATPCGILAPLLTLLEQRPDYYPVSREDNAIGVAVGAALAGAAPAVLMQNSGLGQSVNALASLVVPYEIPILLIVSLRGVYPDPTAENACMGRLTAALMEGMGVPHRTFEPQEATAQIRWAAHVLHAEHRPAALLLPPQSFGWVA
jgi:sulfopyruvate decarboxylase alpha subunit